MGSKRLPGKSMMNLCGKPILYHVIQRVKKAESLDTVVLAIPETPENDALENLARELGIDVFRGSEEDVARRLIEAARNYAADVIVRVSADNPLTAPEEIDRIVAHHLKTGADYSFNATPGMGNNYPDGLGAEVVNYSVLEKIDKIAKEPRYREHVTPYIWDHENEFHIETIQAPPEIAGPEIKLDVDTIEDFKHLESLINALPYNPDGLWSAKEIVKTYRQHFGIKVLILLEHEEQVKDCLEWLEEIKGQKQIIALSPFAVYELDRQNMPYRLPEDYYDSQELYQLGMDNYQKVENICDIVDNSIHKTCPAIAERGIKPALFSIFRLKIVYDAATVRLFQLFKIMNAEKPDVIFVYDSKDYPLGISENAPYLFFDNRESIYTHLLKLPGWKASVVVLPYVQQPEGAYPQRKSYQDIAGKFRDKVVKWLMLHPKSYDLAVAVQKKQWGSLFMKLKGYLTGSKNMPVLLLAAGYNWDNCREELQSAGIIPIFRMSDNLGHWLSEPFPEKVDSGSLRDAWKELQTDNEFRRFFMWEDIDFFPVVKERLQFLVERLTLACLKAYGEVSEVLRNRGVKAVLASGLATCTGRSAAQAAHNAGIPVITWQHGGYGYANLVGVIYNTVMGADALFAWGEGVVEQYAEPARCLGTRLIPVGSASLEALSRKKLQRKAKKVISLNPEKKVVLYVTTTFYQNNLYISFPPPFSDNHYWHTQRAILDVLAQHQDYTIVVKTHPRPIYRETPLRWYAREKGFENCRFIRDECSFADLLPLADVLVIDSPSTVLLEALTTSKPIFVYTGHLHMDDQAQKLLERRAFCHQKLKDFLDALERSLSGGTIDVDLGDTEFLRKFGTADGASGIRAAMALSEIIQNYARNR